MSEKEILSLNQKINDVSLSFNNIKDDYNKLKNEKNINEIKIKEMNDKIKSLSKFQFEFEDVKNQFNDLQKNILDKINKISEQRKIIKDLTIKLSQSQITILNLQSYNQNLEGKINNLNQLCDKFENVYNGVSLDLQKKKKIILNQKKILI